MSPVLKGQRTQAEAARLLGRSVRQALRIQRKRKSRVPWFNRRCAVKPASGNDAHRPLGPGQDLGAILSHQEKRSVANDYTIRFANQVYQLLPPAHPGLRGGQVIVEKMKRNASSRRDGSMKMRFKGRYLEYRKIEEATQGLATPGDEGLSLAPEPIPAEVEAKGRCAVAARPCCGRGEACCGRGEACCGSSDRRTLGSHSCVALSSRRQEESRASRSGHFHLGLTGSSRPPQRRRARV
jgi:hypothetical protein